MLISSNGLNNIKLPQNKSREIYKGKIVRVTDYNVMKPSRGVDEENLLKPCRNLNSINPNLQVFNANRPSVRCQIPAHRSHFYPLVFPSSTIQKNSNRIGNY